MIAIFPASAWTRLLAALGYAVLVAAAVWAVDWSGVATEREAATGAPAAPAAHVLRAEATFAVGRWTVLGDGREIIGQANGRTWSGTVSAHEVLVQAEPDNAADLASGAVRVVADGHETLGWGEGTVSVTVHPAERR